VTAGTDRRAAVRAIPVRLRARLVLLLASAGGLAVFAWPLVISPRGTADVVVASPAFAPQVAKVLAPEPWLTVDEVATALDRVPR